MTLAKRALVSGIVQGVGYRLFVVRVARAMGIRGFVRNLPDGMVEVVVESPSESELERLLVALRKGPPASHVTGVELQDYEGSGNFSGFDIKY